MEGRAKSLDEISKGVNVERQEKVQGLGGREGTQTFSLEKRKSHKGDQGAAREGGRKAGACAVHSTSGFKEKGVINHV